MENKFVIKPCLVRQVSDPSSQIGCDMSRHSCDPQIQLGLGADMLTMICIVQYDILKTVRNLYLSIIFLQKCKMRVSIGQKERRKSGRLKLTFVMVT